jgi:hypothetical protein
VTLLARRSVESHTDPVRKLAVLTLLATLACGRTGLDVDVTSGTDAAADGTGTNDGPPFEDVPDFIDALEAMTSTCNATNCQGCCEPDGSCVTAISEKACGTSGEACTTCMPGEFCKGACFRPQADCDPSNCSGCCENGGAYCTDGTHNVACGVGGELCQDCPQQGTTCVPHSGGGGMCGGVDSCNPQNCLGCCDGKNNSVCSLGLDFGQCGTHGAPCQVCAMDETCVPAAPGGGTCQQNGDCSPQNCSGCCYGKVCAIGNQDVACGMGGSPCADCAALGTRCTGGSCN